MAGQREGRRVTIAVLVGAALAVGLLLVFFLVPRTAPPVPTRTRGEPTVCRLTRGGETVARLVIGAAPAEARAGDVIRCTVAPSFREHVEIWAQLGDAEAVQVSAGQNVFGPTDLAGVEVAAGVMRMYLVRAAGGAPEAGAVKDALKEGGKTPRVRVEAYAVEAR
jgi:hypothetical protein